MQHEITNIIPRGLEVMISENSSLIYGIKLKYAFLDVWRMIKSTKCSRRVGMDLDIFFGIIWKAVTWSNLNKIYDY